MKRNYSMQSFINENTDCIQDPLLMNIKNDGEAVTEKFKNRYIDKDTIKEMEEFVARRRDQRISMGLESIDNE